MGLQYPFPTLSDPISKSEIEGNFAAMASKMGSVVSGDLAASANITPAQLSQPYQEVWVNLWYQAAMPAAASFMDYVVIPGSNNDAPWTMTDVAWVCTDVGDGAGQFNILYGAFVAGLWVTTSTPVAAATITATGGANLGDQGAPLAGGAVSLPFTTYPRTLALQCQTQGVGVLSLGMLRVMCCLKRYLTVSP